MDRFSRRLGERCAAGRDARYAASIERPAPHEYIGGVLAEWVMAALAVAFAILILAGLL